jgi:hypothetical protein
MDQHQREWNEKYDQGSDSRQVDWRESGVLAVFQCFALSPQISFNRLSRPQFQR